MSLRESLLAAASAKAQIQMIYDRGSQPGTIRTVTPLSISDDKLRARCHITGAAKVFKIEHIRLVDAYTRAKEYSDNPPEPKPDFQKLSDVYQHYKDTLEGMGWTPRFEDHGDDSSISLFRRFKNGRQLKTPDVQLYYRKWSNDVFLDDWLNERPERKHLSSKPYGAWKRKGGSATAFSKLDNAAARFMEFAEGLKPLATT